MSVDNFDVLFAKSLSKGGGGSGTDNYNELSNKPQINGNALTGNNTGANLGLQDAITSESKLSSDLVDDTGAENLFVSSTEKSTWGGKQDPATTLSGYGITDAYTKTETGTQITDAIGALDVSSVGGSGKYISAISETDGKISATAETMDTTPTSGSEKAVTSGAVYTALASKQDELSQAQLAAANSGITAEKLAADEAALDWNVNQGVKNLIKLNPDTYTSGNVVAKLNDDGTVSVSLSSGSTANTTFSRAITTIVDLRDMDLILNGCPSGGNYSSGYALYISDDGTTKEKDEGNGVLVPKNTTVTTSYLALIVRSGTAISGTLTFKPMMRPAYITDSTFRPYAPTNRELYEMIQALQNGTRSAPALAKAEPDEEPETGEEETR